MHLARSLRSLSSAQSKAIKVPTYTSKVAQVRQFTTKSTKISNIKTHTFTVNRQLATASTSKVQSKPDVPAPQIKEEEDEIEEDLEEVDVEIEDDQETVLTQYYERLDVEDASDFEDLKEFLVDRSENGTLNLGEVEIEELTQQDLQPVINKVKEGKDLSVGQIEQAIFRIGTKKTVTAIKDAIKTKNVDALGEALTRGERIEERFVEYLDETSFGELSAINSNDVITLENRAAEIGQQYIESDLIEAFKEKDVAAIQEILSEAEFIGEGQLDLLEESDLAHFGPADFEDLALENIVEYIQEVVAARVGPALKDAIRSGDVEYIQGLVFDYMQDMVTEEDFGYPLYALELLKAEDLKEIADEIDTKDLGDLIGEIGNIVETRLEGDLKAAIKSKNVQKVKQLLSQYSSLPINEEDPSELDGITDTLLAEINARVGDKSLLDIETAFKDALDMQTVVESSDIAIERSLKDAILAKDLDSFRGELIESNFLDATEAELLDASVFGKLAQNLQTKSGADIISEVSEVVKQKGVEAFKKAIKEKKVDDLKALSDAFFDIEIDFAPEDFDKVSSKISGANNLDDVDEVLGSYLETKQHTEITKAISSGNLQGLKDSLKKYELFEESQSKVLDAQDVASFKENINQKSLDDLVEEIAAAIDIKFTHSIKSAVESKDVAALRNTLSQLNVLTESQRKDFTVEDIDVLVSKFDLKIPQLWDTFDLEDFATMFQDVVEEKVTTSLLDSINNGNLQNIKSQLTAQFETPAELLDQLDAEALQELKETFADEAATLYDVKKEIYKLIDEKRGLEFDEDAFDSDYYRVAELEDEVEEEVDEQDEEDALQDLEQSAADNDVLIDIVAALQKKDFVSLRDILRGEFQYNNPTELELVTEKELSGLINAAKVNGLAGRDLFDVVEEIDNIILKKKGLPTKVDVEEEEQEEVEEDDIENLEINPQNYGRILKSLTHDDLETLRDIRESETASTEPLHEPPINVPGIKGKYASHLWSLGMENDSLDELEKDADQFALFIQHPSIQRELIHNSRRATSVKAKVFQRLFANNSTLSEPFKNFVVSVVKEGNEGRLSDIMASYKEMMKVWRGEIDAIVWTPRPLSDLEEKELCDTIKDNFVRPFQLPKFDIRVDDTLIGGIKLKVGFQSFDFTKNKEINDYLERIRTTVDTKYRESMEARKRDLKLD